MRKILLFLFLATCSQAIHASWFGDLFKNVPLETKMPEVTQNDTQVIVTMYVPEDIDPDDIHVEIKDKTLHVSGERNTKREVHKEGYYHSSISSSSFNRSVSLPCFVDELATTAEIADGVLVITMPKIQEDIAMKKIRVVKSQK